MDKVKNIFKNIIFRVGQLFIKIRISILFQFKLKPKILKMKSFVKKIVELKRDLFPIGKSLFVFPGKDDTLYFIILKEEAVITVMEVYDEILNKIPERYQILPKIKFNELSIV
jgi:hypothetical protein